ncbi:MAG: YjfB family protein [Lachnospiraceae bacterium]|nr:YjfB family protein [Lachnospiraceae bacterium]
MNISSLGNTGMGLQISDTRSMNAIDVAMLKKSLDSVETNGDMITQMMERSVNPNIGANIDIRL